MKTKVNHTAFLDLENGLANKASGFWRHEWQAISPKLAQAIKDQNWGEANRIVDILDCRAIVRRSLQYALTIGLSSLLLGASRLGNVKNSVIVKRPPVRQLKNAIIQWGNQLIHNAPTLLKQHLHEHLAELEHDSVQSTQVIKDDTGFINEDDLQEFLQTVQVDGDDFMSLAASLMVSRLSSFGFLAEAQYQGITQYRISAVLDEHTCAVCEELDGQVFDVSAGVSQATSIMDAEDADSLRSIAPWPSQSKSSIASLQDADSQDLVDSGLALPPYHPNCRCITVAVSDGQTSDTTAEAESAEREFTDDTDVIAELLEGQESDPEFGSILVALGLVALPRNKDQTLDSFGTNLDDEDYDGDEDTGYLVEGEDVDVGEGGAEYDETGIEEEVYTPEDLIAQAKAKRDREREELAAQAGFIEKIDVYHMPAGTPEGGQFASAPGSGSKHSLLKEKDYSKLETMPKEIDGFLINVVHLGTNDLDIMAQTAGDEIQVNQDSPGWKNPNYAQEAFKDGWTSSDDPNHAIYHEAGHAHWLAHVDQQTRWEVDHTDAESGNKIFNRLSKEVSKYARTSAPEFIAEVYAGLRSGGFFSDHVMNLYHLWGGPSDNLPKS